MLRDSQRKKVFTSIRAAAPLIGQKFTEMKDVERFVKRIVTRAALITRYGTTLESIQVRDGRGFGWTTGSANEGGYITVPHVQRSSLYILRGLAYTIHQRQRRAWRFVERAGSRHMELRGLCANNGWQYCAILMDLVRYGMGEAEADILKEQFRKNKVKWSEPTARVLTEAQKKVAVARGKSLAEMNRDRKKRLAFMEEHPEAELASPDEFIDPHWETLYRVWR